MNGNSSVVMEKAATSGFNPKTAATGSFSRSATTMKHSCPGRQSHDSRLCKNIFLKENGTCQAAPLILTGSQGGTIENHHRLWALSSKGIDYDIDRH